MENDHISDIDECNTTDGLIRHNCDRQLGVCKNYANSFHCSCPKGYIMKPETGTQCHGKGLPRKIPF